MTDREQRLREIRERHAVSTPGEWYVGALGADDDPCWWAYIGVRDTPDEHGFDDFITGNYDYEEGGVCSSQEDAEFIAHAHQDVPYLLAEIERMEKAARIIQEQCAQGRCITFEQAYEDAEELMP